MTGTRAICFAACTVSCPATFFVFDFTAATRLTGASLRFGFSAAMGAAFIAVAGRVDEALDFAAGRTVFAVFFIAFAMGLTADG
ncbi:MAG: hypothetical protein ACRYGK_08670 [Janthinobacterium lividum]